MRYGNGYISQVGLIFLASDQYPVDFLINPLKPIALFPPFTERKGFDVFPPLRKSLTIAIIFFFFRKKFQGGGVK